MSFEEKSVIATTTAMAIAYGIYFAVVARWTLTTPAADIAYQPLMVLTVILLVVMLVVGQIAIAVSDPAEAGERDERDRLIDLRGANLGGYVLAVGVFLALVLAMAGVEQFYIANVLLLWWVLAELSSGVTRIVLYRRGPG
jgi:hypothetical protein